MTAASEVSHWSSQTVPHTPLAQTSTRPSLEFIPPTNLTSPRLQSVAEKNISVIHNVLQGTYMLII